MGASVTKLIGGNDEEEEKDMRELVQSLERQAEADSKLFMSKVMHSGLEKDKLVPISCILYKYSSVEIVASNDNQALLSYGIKDTVQKASSSNIAGAITGVLSTALKALLEKRGSEVSTEEGYTINIGKMAGIERLDYRMSLQTFQSDTWRKKMSSVLTTTVVVSSCDASKLKHNDTTVLIQQCFGSETYDTQVAVRDLLYLALDEETAPEKKAVMEIELIKKINNNFLGALGVKDETKLQQEYELWQTTQIKSMQAKYGFDKDGKTVVPVTGK
jgi:hypothetical protein